MYDNLASRIFSRRSNLKLVSSKAYYDEGDWEDILQSFLGEELLVDSNRHMCPRYFCVSTKMDLSPPQPLIWRNYNYPLLQVLL